ncbi:MAG TPA: hypothetical protein VHY35_01645 [Stellaceae bacterium]|jgi:hypothetical protein|nr:hypothetical protein [Stellaceae bacterium]
MPDPLLDPLDIAVSLLGAHPDPAVRELATRLRDDATDRAERRSRRDLLLRQFAAAEFGQVSISRQAAMIGEAMTRYRAGGWRQAQRCTECPHSAGSRAAMLWEILRCSDRLLSSRQLRKIVGPRGMERANFSA